MTEDVRLQVQYQGGNGCTVRFAWGLSALRKVLEDSIYFNRPALIGRSEVRTGLMRKCRINTACSGRRPCMHLLTIIVCD